MPETETVLPEQPCTGLMQALAPIAARRPVHIIVSPSTEQPGFLHLVCQPARNSDDEEAELTAGFSADASPEDLDAQLPGIMTSTWVPAHRSLQQILDQVAKGAEAARLTVIDKQKTGGKGGKGGKAASGGGQTTLIAPASGDAAAAPAPAHLALPAKTTTPSTDSPAPAPTGPADSQLVIGEEAEAPAPAASGEEPNSGAAVPQPAVAPAAPEASSISTAAGTDAAPREAAAPAEEPAAAGGPVPAEDGISSLFK